MRIREEMTDQEHAAIIEAIDKARSTSLFIKVPATALRHLMTDYAEYRNAAEPVRVIRAEPVTAAAPAGWDVAHV